jgi:DNA-nicking Smr family endonuclease
MDEGTKISDDDIRLFRESVAGVRPLSVQRIIPQRTPPKPRARFRRADDRQVLADSLDDTVDAAELGTGEELWFHKAGIQRQVVRKLRRGHYRAAAALDLHGMSVAAARPALAEFIAEAHARDLRCVRVVHGKGRRSGPQGPVLKGKVSQWLQRRADVLAFCSARPVDGGTGAVYVLLSR